MLNLDCIGKYYFFDRKMNPKQWILTAVIGLLLLVDSLPTGNHELFYLFIIIWAVEILKKRALMKYILVLF